MPEHHTKITLLPQDFIHCPRDELIVLIARMLNSLIQINDKYNGASSIDSISPSNLTRFHSRTPPSITVYSYLARLARYSSLENAVLLTAVYYIDLLSTVYSSFTLNSLTVHRFLLAATTVGSKGLCDSFCTNSHYAKVGGVHANELDILEREFLIKVNYRILPRDLNIENSANDQKISTAQERKRSINTLEDEKNNMTEIEEPPEQQSASTSASTSTLNSAAASASSSSGNSGEIKGTEQHLLKNGGYNVLDLYYKKMILLVGKETSKDDSSAVEPVHYFVDDESLIPEDSNLIKTEPDTLDNESFNKLIGAFLKAYNEEVKVFKRQKKSVSNTTNVGLDNNISITMKQE